MPSILDIGMESVKDKELNIIKLGYCDKLQWPKTKDCIAWCGIFFANYKLIMLSCSFSFTFYHSYYKQEVKALFNREEGQK